MFFFLSGLFFFCMLAGPLFNELRLGAVSLWKLVGHELRDALA